MANIFLDQNETFIVSGADDRLFGRPGGAETVLLQSSASGLRLDGNIERLDVAATAQETNLRVNTSGQLEVVIAGNVIATGSSGLNQSVDLRFSDGNVILTQTGATSFTIADPDEPQTSVTIDQSNSQAGDSVSLGIDTSDAGAGGAPSGPTITNSGAVFFDMEPVFLDPPSSANIVELGEEDTPGTLRVINGAQLDVAGDNSRITVSPGNALEFADPSTSPELPQSALEVLGGSQVTIDTPQDFGGLLIGDGGNGSGRVLVRDEQSSIDLTGDNFQLSVGQFGTGQLVVKDGGSVTAEDGFHPIGNAAGSNGTVVVSGRASRFETPGTVAVAQGFFDDQGDDEPSNDFGVPDATTTGRLTVSNQANVQAGELLVGSEPNSEGNVLVEGIGDVEVGGFTVGVEGAGNMTIRDGGTVGSTGSFNAIANAAGSTGAVMVDGSGSELGAQGSFTIGNGVFDDQGDTDPSNDFGQQGAVTNASMTVSNSAKVSTSGDSTGIIVGSEAMVDGSVASLTVASGGTLETPNLQGRGPNSAITITGSGTQVNVSSAFGVPFPDFAPEGGFLRAARNDGENGEINVLNGADVTVSASEGTSGPGIQIARQPGSNGSMMIDGQNTSVEVIQTTPTIEGANFGPYLQAGRSGAGDVQVRNGATLLVEGPQSSIVISQGNADEFADPGNAPALEQSRLLVADGGEVTLRDPDPFDTGSISGLEVGNRENGNGLLRVDGNGSIVSIEGEQEPFMNVGDEGQGVLEAFDGGVVSGMFLSFGAAPTGNGTGVVSGTESAISLAGKTGDLGTNPGQAAFMQVGRSGTGELTVENGGKITISGENEGVYPGFSVGFNESSQGTMTVTDSQSNVTVLGGTDTGFGSAGIIYVGRGGTGDLTVSDGGTITNSDDGIMMVGRSATSAGTLTVTGTDSSLDVGQRLFVGSDVDFDTGDPLPDQGGAGDVVVEAGGRLEAGDAQNDGIADIVVGAGSTLEIENGGTLLGDVRVVGGAFDLADGATHDGDLIS